MKPKLIDAAAANLEERTPEERLRNLPPHLRLLVTPEGLEKAKEDQAKWAREEQSPFIGVSPREATRGRARREIPEWEAARTQVAVKLAAERAKETPDSNTVIHLQERLDHFSRLLAQALAEVGEFAAAASVHPDEAEKAHYLRLHHAVWRDDEEECGPDCHAQFEANPNILTRENVLAEVFSPKHGAMMLAIECYSCKSLNVKYPPESLRAQRAARSRARALTRTATSPRHARDILERERLTSEHIYKRP